MTRPGSTSYIAVAPSLPEPTPANSTPETGKIRGVRTLTTALTVREDLGVCLRLIRRCVDPLAVAVNILRSLVAWPEALRTARSALELVAAPDPPPAQDDDREEPVEAPDAYGTWDGRG